MDGISHTSLVIACLRKLQGWNMESIMGEISRFEPDHEDLPLHSFINTYLTSSDTPFPLPLPPYPSWLWPTGPPVPASLAQGSSSTKSSTRERTASAPGNISSTNNVLPFPHPLTARRHPTMKLSFPPLPPPPANANASSGSANVQSPQLAAQNPNIALSRVSSIRGSAIKSPDQSTSSASSTMDQTGLVGAAASILSNGLSRVASVVSPSSTSGSATGVGIMGGGGDEKSKRLSRNVSFENETAYLEWKSHTGYASPEKLSRQPTNLSSEEMSEAEKEMEMDLGEVDPRVMAQRLDSGAGDEAGIVEMEEEGDEDEEEDDDEYEEDDEDEDEDDDEDEDLQPPSQYISALDLAGF